MASILEISLVIPKLWDTLWRTVVGLSLSIVVGLGFGVIMGFSKTMRIALYPLLVGFNAIPKATVVPVIALMFVGFHDMNTILIVILISFFPIAITIFLVWGIYKLGELLLFLWNGDVD